MAEVLVVFDIRMVAVDGRTYQPQACGRPRPDGLWEGWIEFVPVGGTVLRTGTETTQPDWNDLMYWAEGLTSTYLEGALERALGDRPGRPRVEPPLRASEFEAPAEPRWRAAEARARAVLDPFHVYAEGAELLRGQLSALSDDQLRNIVQGYELADVDARDLERAGRSELTSMIMRGAARGAR